MSWMTPDGRPHECPRRDVRDFDEKQKARCVVMKALQQQGWSLREIAEFFTGRWHPEQVKRLIRATPKESRIESVA